MRGSNVIRAIALGLLIVALPTSAQGPIDCEKESDSVQAMKERFWWEGCLKLKELRPEVEKELAKGSDKKLADRVYASIGLMGCPT